MNLEQQSIATADHPETVVILGGHVERWAEYSHDEDRVEARYVYRMIDQGHASDLIVNRIPVRWLNATVAMRPTYGDDLDPARPGHALFTGEYAWVHPFTAWREGSYDLPGGAQSKLRAALEVDGAAFLSCVDHDAVIAHYWASRLARFEEARADLNAKLDVMASQLVNRTLPARTRTDLRLA